MSLQDNLNAEAEFIAAVVAELEAEKMNKAEQFFYDNAGWGYNPASETEDEGRTRGAKRLAEAEEWARDNFYWFDWVLDDQRCSCNEGKPIRGHQPFGCIMRSDNDDSHQSLWGICGADGKYRRVIQAELSLEEMPESAISAELRYISL